MLSARALVAKWRSEAVALTEQNEYAVVGTLVQCADELEATLAAAPTLLTAEQRQALEELDPKNPYELASGFQRLLAPHDPDGVFTYRSMLEWLLAADARMAGGGA